MGVEEEKEHADNCRRMWLWVMITSLRELGSKNEGIQERAEKWVLGEGFSWVCGIFNIDENEANEAREFVVKNYWKVGLANFSQEGVFGVDLRGRFAL